MADPTTHTKAVFSLDRKIVDIIELGKGLYNKGSAVLMPGKLGSEEGSKELLSDLSALAEQAGIKALAAVYKQFEFDNRKRIIIAGHASGELNDIKKHFDLADLRAKNVYYLLTGQRALWGDQCVRSGKILDLKRILAYASLFRGGWDCRDKGDMDDKWTDKTTEATEKFINGYNKDKAHKEKLAPGLAALVKKEKNWNFPLWKAAFDIYCEDICTFLKIKPADPMKLPRKELKFVLKDRECVACGESFPLVEIQSSYRKEQYRRVDILFFNEKEAPGYGKKVRRFVCPPGGAAKHKSAECPIWYKKHIKANYLDPEKELKYIAYHLTFTYYDKTAGNIRSVPGGLGIYAYHYEGAGPAKVRKEIDTITKYYDRVYTVELEDDTARKNIYFEFGTVEPANPNLRYWVYTKDKNSNSKIEKKTAANVIVFSTVDRFKYYDLPQLWSSENYWTRYKSGNDFKAERFDEVMKNQKKLKPYAGGKTKATEPLYFALDDIVLIKADGKQDIKDKDNTGADKALSGDSRVALLYLDKDDKFKVKVYSPMAKAAYFTDIKFTENLISNYHRSTRAVIFCSDFYHVYDKRTEKVVGFDFSKKHILGARAARLNDTEVSHTQPLILTDNTHRTNGYQGVGCGNFDLHFIFRCGLSKGKSVSALILYWSGRFEKDVANGGTDADAKNFVEKGMENAMGRNNAKDYQFEKHSGTRDMIIKMRIFYEAKLKDRGGTHKCLVKVRDDNGGSSIGPTNATYRKSAYKVELRHFQQGPADPPDPLNKVADYDGTKSMRLVGAHEQGHASGWDDEYISYLDEKDALPACDQSYYTDTATGKVYYHGAPYSLDKLAIMTNNHVIRMRHFWIYANWLNDMGKTGKPMAKFLDNTKFKITYKDLNYELIKNRRLHYPAYQKDNHSLAANSKADLILYKLGEDEMSKTIVSGQAFTGMLIVRTYLSCRFSPGASWTGNNIANWLIDLQKRIDLMLSKKFHLGCTSKPDHPFKNTYLRFMPHYEVRAGAGAAFASTHFRIEVKKDDAGTFNPVGTTLNVSNDCAPKKIIRYLYGKITGTANLDKDDLTKISDWMSDAAVTNETYEVQDL